MKQTVTLAELIISIALLGVIILGVAAFDMSSRYFLKSADLKSKILNEMTFVLEHINKNVAVATGDRDNLGIRIVNSHQVWIRKDINMFGTPNNTPDKYSDDFWVEYRINPDDPHKLEVCADFNITANSCEDIYESLTSKLVRDTTNPNNDFSFSQDLDNGVLLGINNLRLRYDPSSKRDATTNPEVFMPRVVFSSLSHTY